MRKRNFKKATLSEVQEMKRLYRLGVSANEIGRRLGRDHTTIRWWLIHEKVPLRSIREAMARKKEKLIKDSFGLCVYCRKSKRDIRWKQTRYCGIKCWDLATGKEKKSWWSPVRLKTEL